MKSLSGKFVVRLSPQVHQQLKSESLKRGLSLNELCQERLSLPNQSRAQKTSPLPQSVLTQILDTAKKLELPIEGILLFGSFARGEQDESSDIDLLVILSPEKKIERTLYQEWDLAFSNYRFCGSHEITVHFVYLPEDLKKCGSIWLECALEGILIFELKDTKIQKKVLQIRNLIAQGRWRRKFAHGHPYWTEEKL
ncbi:toxin-antitoxin system HicB family antitoxin [bacterium]|nr:toxin-antitoxin system HicB family antitoxin [bacterium]